LEKKEENLITVESNIILNTFVLESQHEFPGYHGNIPEKSQLYIFRIVQELMNNILKHSQAKNASLRFTFDGNFLTIQVNDDGIGFDTSNIDFGNGINNIMERTELLYGKIKFSSKPSQGTEVLINIPVKYGKN